MSHGIHKWNARNKKNIDMFSNDIISDPHRIRHLDQEVTFWGGICLLNKRHLDFSKIYKLDHSSKLSTFAAFDFSSEDDRDYDFIIINQGLIFVPKNTSYTECRDVITCYGSDGFQVIDLNKSDVKFHNWIARLLLAGIPPRYSWIQNWIETE